MRRLLFAIVLALLAAAPADARHAAASCPGLTAEASGNGMTGGTLAWSITFTNRGAKPCLVEGRPFLRIAPSRFPVTVVDILPGEFGTGRPVRLLLRHGRSVHAVVAVERRCGDFSKRVARTLHATVGWGGATAAVAGEACAREGAAVYVSSFLR